MGPLVATLALISPALLGCTSDHHVSPWGARGAPPIGLFAQAPDLAAELRLVDEETARLGLTKTFERAITPRGAPSATIVLRAFEGRDTLGRTTHAVRAASSRGVILAAGPLDATSPREAATELVVDRSGADLTGDGSPDLLLANERGELELWQLSQLGATRVEVEIEIAPTELVELRGALAFQGTLEIKVDSLLVRFVDAATFDGKRFSDRSDAARALHAARAAAAETGPDATKVARALERGFHRVLAGAAKASVLADLDAVQVPASMAAGFAKARAKIEALRPRASAP